MSAHDEITALALKMMRAAESGDIEAFRACYADDATLWFNFNDRTVSIDEHLANAGGMHKHIENLRYEDIRVTPFAGGYVQQHRARGDLADDQKLDLPSCFVVAVRDGLIVHRDEYIDTASLTFLRG